LLAACGDQPTATSSTPLPAVDASTQGPLCTAITDTDDALQGITKSTDTTTESVSKLDKAQSEWGDAAIAASTAYSAHLISSSDLSSKLTAIQTDVGHIKVDLNNGTDASTDESQTLTDLNALPSSAHC
jgi:hypothetical protein